MKKIIYILLGLVILSPLNISAQFWKNNDKKKPKEVVEEAPLPIKETRSTVPQNEVKTAVKEPQNKAPKTTVVQPKKEQKTFVKKKAGNTLQPELDSGSIENQFDYIITKSSGFKEFQLIRKTSILKVKEHALDSLRIVREELKTSKESFRGTDKMIKQLKGEVVSLQGEIEELSQVKDEVTFLGGSCTKATYNSIVWSIIIVLALALAFFVFQFKNNFVVNKRNKDGINKLEDELDQSKKKALKKEQELMRKLQDEVNKNNPG